MGILPFICTIIILGPKHSGKTSAGRELAKLLGACGTLRNSYEETPDFTPFEAPLGACKEHFYDKSQKCSILRAKPHKLLGACETLHNSYEETPDFTPFEAPGGPFTDLDELIEAQTGKSPRALFRESPETFQTAELRALESLLSVHAPKGVAECGGIAGQDHDAPRVIAAGGGIIDNPGARRLLLGGNGIFLVNLEVSAETAWERISQAAARGGELPPFLDTEIPRETHRLLHERRSAAYREIARLTVSGEGKTPEETGRELFKTLETIIRLKAINYKKTT